MSQHDDRSASTDLPRTTGEFRAASDISASTAEFKRFMGEQDQPDRRGGASAWPEQPWAGQGAGDRRPSRRTMYLAGALAVLVVLIIILIAVG